MLVGRSVLPRHDGIRINIRLGHRKRGGTLDVARIVIRRSPIPDESAAVSQAMPPWSETIAAGGVSTLAVTAAAVCRAAQEGEAGWRPINSISHILWGSDAADQRQFTVRYTVSGLLLNVVACGFWALVFRLWRSKKRPSFIQSAGRGIGVSTLAYITDYYLVPRRFTPGFELCLSRHSFPWIYGALAVGLILPDALTGIRRRTRR